MRRPKFFTLITVIVLSSGCQNLTERKIIGNYYLVSTDRNEDETSLSYKLSSGDNYIGIIPETVFEIGYNEFFIIAKQHPKDINKNQDKSGINFFILPIMTLDTLYPQKYLLGPFNETNFINERKKLNIPDSVSFSIEVK
jgi:hypothetical protein